jgi:hypothetical protein
MTMYLPNSAVRPTGYEAGEFIAAPDSLDRDRVDEKHINAPRTTPPSPGSGQQPNRGGTTHPAS